MKGHTRALAAVTGAAVCIVAYTRFRDRTFASDRQARSKALALCIRTCGALVFPVLLSNLLPMNKRACTSSIPALMWVVAVHLLDSHLVVNGTAKEDGRLGSVKMDANLIAGLSFGLSGFVGAKSQGPYGALFLVAVVLCLAFVLPSHNLKHGTNEEQYLDSIQKTILFNSMGLILAGVSMTHAYGDQKSGHDAMAHAAASLADGDA